MKKLIGTIIVSVMAVNAHAIFYGMPVDVTGDNLQGVEIKQGDTPLPKTAIFPIDETLWKMPRHYLKIVKGRVIERTAKEKAFAELLLIYKKQVEGVWVELTAEEKRLLTVPEFYKNPDGTEMTAEEKAVVDAATEAARQDAKKQELKDYENSYITFLKTEWTAILRQHEIIGAEETIDASVSYAKNLEYLARLKAIDADVYRKFGTELGIAKEVIEINFGADIDDITWHK